METRSNIQPASVGISDILYLLPGKPNDPSPPDNATRVRLNPTLTWGYSFGRQGDMSRQFTPITYTVYLDTCLNPKIIVAADTITTKINEPWNGNVTVSVSLDQVDLKVNTVYYWKVGIRDAVGASQTSDIWHFTTREEISLPLVTTTPVTTFTGVTATVGGNVLLDGECYTDRGIFIGTSKPVELTGTKIKMGNGVGSFSTLLTGLNLNTTYYVKAYAINLKGTVYGDEVSFTTNPDYDLPTLTTTLDSYTDKSARSGGNIVYDGGAHITERGVCWSLSENPTISDNKTTEGPGTGSFNSTLTGLSFLTTYYIRAYATNSTGTGYGNQISLTTLGTLTDKDSNLYYTKLIGNHIWMISNLKTTRLNDGTSIQNVTNSSEWSVITTPGYCWYNNDIANKTIYGALYNWTAANSDKLCPTGWHVSTDDDWDDLIHLFGGHYVAGDNLKSTTGWMSTHTTDNESGFNGLPGGYLSSGYGFLDCGSTGIWRANPFYLILYSSSSSASFSSNYGEKIWLSVRCVKDY
jgi:uncharacterized protein (TIGR02145 family)